MRLRERLPYTPGKMTVHGCRSRRDPGPASNATDATGAAPRRLSTLDAPSTTAFSSSHIDAMRAHHRSLDVGCPPTPHRNRYVLPDTCSWLSDPPQLVASTSREDIVTCSDELTSLLTLHSIAKCRALCKSTRVSSTRVSPSLTITAYANVGSAGSNDPSPRDAH